jgi:hypothetical protein
MSADGGDTAFPIVVAEWGRNSEGNWRPGRSGLSPPSANRNSDEQSRES